MSFGEEGKYARPKDGSVPGFNQIRVHFFLNGLPDRGEENDTKPPV